VKEGRLIIRVVAISKMARRRRGNRRTPLSICECLNVKKNAHAMPKTSDCPKGTPYARPCFRVSWARRGSSPWVENGLGLLVHRMGWASLLFGSFCVALSKVTQRSKSQESWHPFLGKAARPSSQSLSQARAARERQPSSVTPFALGPDERRIGLRNWRRWL
jgi:hypothetical protein